MNTVRLQESADACRENVVQETRDFTRNTEDGTLFAASKRNKRRAPDWNRRIAALTCAIMLATSGCVANDAAPSGAADVTKSTTLQARETVPEATATVQEPFGGPGGEGGFAMSNAETTVTVTPAPVAANISDRDREGTWEEASAVGIVCTGTAATISGMGASCIDGVLTVTKAGVYVLSGALTGRIVVTAGKDDKVQLVFNGLEVASDDGPALWVTQADKVFLTVAGGTKNLLSDGESYAEALLDADNEPDACIFSKDDLTINGTGALTVSGNLRHGIVSKDTLSVVDTALTVSAKDDALKGTDAVYVSGDAALTLTAGNDTVHTKGDFVQESGMMTLTAGDDGVHADQNLTVLGGTIAVLASTEGLESLMLCIVGGDVSIVSSDDGLNATSSAEETQTTIAETAAETDAATAATPQPEGGRARPDMPGDFDGEFVPGGQDGVQFGGMGGERGTFAFVEGALIAISGGTVTVTAGGDGLDSNGDLLITGGVVTVSTTPNTGNGALDYNGGAAITGGTVIALGEAGMAASFGNGSTQAVLSVTADALQSGGTAVMLLDATGTELARFTPKNDWQNAVVSVPGMAVGGTYTLACGQTTVCEVTLDALLSAYGNAVGGRMQFSGGRGGGPGGKMGGGPRSGDMDERSGMAQGPQDAQTTPGVATAE